MHPVAEELERKLNELDPSRAEQLAAVVRAAIVLAGAAPLRDAKGWPLRYFEQTAGALADEPFERPDQGTFPKREDW